MDDERYLDLLLTENIRLKKENVRLKELNLEMVEVIEGVRRWYVNGSRSGKTLNDMLTLLFELADKAEGREE